MIEFNTVVIRSEGSVNRFWDFTQADGTHVKFYAYEESPRCDNTDEFVHENNDALSDWLDAMFELPQVVEACEGEIYNADEDAIDIELNLSLEVIKVTIEEQDE